MFSKKGESSFPLKRKGKAGGEREIEAGKQTDKEKGR
jgi:hypothetical protein